MKQRKNYDINIVVMKNNWFESDQLDYLKDNCQTIYLERIGEISTVKIKKNLCNDNIGDRSI